MSAARTAFRRLVRAHGSDPTAEQTFNAGMRHWLTPDGSAGVAFTVGHCLGQRVWMGAGGPVCAPEARAATARAFESAARAHGARPAWFGVDTPMVDLIGPGHAALVVGAEPIWDPAAWSATVSARASLRSQVGRAARQGVVYAEVDAPAAAADAGVQAVLADWLGTRGMPPLGFLADPFVLDRPGDRRAFVARAGGAGRVVGVLWLSPIPARNGWLVEWNWRGAGAPNGVTDGLLNASMAAVAAEGAAFATLGLVPLSSFAPPSHPPPSPALRLLLRWTRAHARRFYRFDGLERFKAKYRPGRWEPLHLVVPGTHVGIRDLYAVADVFAGRRGPARLVGSALAGAVADEVHTLRHAAHLD